MSHAPRVAVALVAALALPSCGASSAYHTNQDWAQAPQRQVATGGGGGRARTQSVRRSRGRYFKAVAKAESAPAPRPPAVAKSSPRRRRRRPRPREISGRRARPNGASLSKKFSGKATSGGLQKGKATKVYRVDDAMLEPEQDAPQKVVYMGYLKLRVRRRIPTVDAITAQVRKAGGYIERLGSRTMVVRVPAGDFDAAMARFAALGHVLARRVQALDVTAQFTDLDARLAVAKEARDRLLALLHTVKDVKERLRIVQEIKRLSEQIETVESTLGTLKNLIAYYTITIDLVPQDQRRGRVTHRSPFPWVRGLVPHRITLRDDDVTLPVAKGFVRFDKADTWHARAADTAMIRAARVRNEPRGDTGFWAAAVRHELLGRGEVALTSGDASGVRWQVFRNRDVEPRVWLVAVRERGEHIAVAEAFFPTEKSWERHRGAVLAVLGSLEVK